MKIDDLRIPKEHDKRRKLTDDDVHYIHTAYADGVSIRAIARAVGVSRRLVQFTLFPERKDANLQARHDRGGTMIYYDKDKHKAAMARHREHKRNVGVPAPILEDRKER